MAIKVSVKSRFVFNGKEYGSLDELPENVREAYRKARADGAAGAPTTKVKVVFNGVEFESVDAMPPEARRLYEDALAAAAGGSLSGPGGPVGALASRAGDSERAQAVSAAPIEPGASGPRRLPVALVLGLMLLLMLLGFYLYRAAAPR